MEIISQHAKKIMEECKERAEDMGLRFESETLEYIVTNREFLELSPKVMIPTLYDYWVNDVEVLKENAKYKLQPSNPYETVINSRPAISFYNDNNPDWLNIMIFYHVLGHIDFFQNNRLFEHTWKDDFVGQALADKRLINQLRSRNGRWVDYAIEFSRNMDNITGYFDTIAKINYDGSKDPAPKIEYYFSTFLQDIEKVSQHDFFTEIERYNDLIEGVGENVGESVFFGEIRKKYPEFEAMFEKYVNKQKSQNEVVDLMTFVRDHSPFLRKEENKWMKEIMTIIRNTGIYFEPQRRTKIINEGWASYWHDRLFRADERIKGHEIAYAKINAMVTSINPVGLNPYAIGLRLLEHVIDLANKGKLEYNFQKLMDIEGRKNFDNQSNKGNEALFALRTHFSDFTLINTFTSQDFVDEHNLFVVGKRVNQERKTYEYYVKSRKGEDYKKMLIDSLYHPPVIRPIPDKSSDENLYLEHEFEGKQLIQDFIPNTMLGISYMWGGQVQLKTTEIHRRNPEANGEPPVFEYRPVLYTMKGKQVSKKNL